MKTTYDIVRKLFLAYFYSFSNILAYFYNFSNISYGDSLYENNLTLFYLLL